MSMAEAENRQISIHWWNFGKKTLDFKGSYKDYLLKRGIMITGTTHPCQKDISGLRFTISLSSSLVTLDSYGDDIEGFDKAILVFLTLLGDKALFYNGRREYKVNWR